MPKIDLILSEKGIDDAIRQLQEYAEKVKKAPERIVSSLVADGQTVASERLASIVDPDGNIDARVSGNVNGNRGNVTLSGSQAAFLEFGTGPVGAAKPHPVSGKFGWKYASGPRIRAFKNGRIGWRYFDRSKHHYRITSGIAPQNILLNAAAQMRMNIVQRAKEALK